MKRLVALAVIGAFASGLIATWAFNQATEQAGAAPPCPSNQNRPRCTPTPTVTPTATATTTPIPTLQVREDQITIFDNCCGGVLVPASSEFQTIWDFLLVGLDPLDYPASSVFRLEVVLSKGPGTDCLRLFNMTSGSAVSGSESCISGAGVVRQRFGPFGLVAGEHSYTVQGQSDYAGGYLVAARIIVEWTELVP